MRDMSDYYEFKKFKKMETFISELVYKSRNMRSQAADLKLQADTIDDVVSRLSDELTLVTTPTQP